MCTIHIQIFYLMGMLLYLASITSPYISYTVHQCAQFSHDPKASHKIGLKHIARYLNGTRDKGLIMKPEIQDLKSYLFVDEEFAELFGSEEKIDPISVKS